MEFKNNEAIYLQIAAYVSEQILLGKWLPDQKIPSVRDLAIELQVNPNTVMRTYEHMQNREVIYNKRGIGFFVTPEGVARVKEQRRERFLQQEMPEFFKTIFLLGIGLEELQERFKTFTKEQLEPNPKPHENQ
jgi:GntR family transcriptional regulator